METEGYPVEILPNSAWMDKIPVERILSIPNSYIHRRSDLPLEKAFFEGIPDKRHLFTEKLGDVFKHPFGLSVNLLGGSFDVGLHAKWNTKPPGSDYWTDDKDIDLSKFEGCYSRISEDYPNFYFNCRLIHDKIIKYPRTIPNRKERELFDFNSVLTDVDHASGEDSEEGKKKDPNEIMAQGILKLHHHPTNLNYWHWQVDQGTRRLVVDEKGIKRETIEMMPEKKKSSAWAHEFFDAMVEYLWSILEFNPPSIGEIEEHVYLKPPTST